MASAARRDSGGLQHDEIQFQEFSTEKEKARRAEERYKHAALETCGLSLPESAERLNRQHHTYIHMHTLFSSFGSSNFVI